MEFYVDDWNVHFKVTRVLALEILGIFIGKNRDIDGIKKNREEY